MQMQLSTLNVDGLYYNCGVHWSTGQRSDARTPANGRHRYERYDNVKPWEIGGVWIGHHDELLQNVYADTTPSTGHADELQVFVLQLTSFSSGDEILSQSDGGINRRGRIDP